MKVNQKENRNKMKKWKKLKSTIFSFDSLRISQISYALVVMFDNVIVEMKEEERHNKVVKKSVENNLYIQNQRSISRS